MALSSRGLSTVLALGSVIAAIVGYVIGVEANVVTGGGHGAAAPAQQSRTAVAASVLLAPPPGWQAIAAVPVPFELERALVFAPPAQAQRMGLLTGLAQGGEATPLPTSLLARMTGPPQAEVVALSQTEAFRYSGVRLAGYGGRLTIYAIPAPGGATTLLACYAQGAGTTLTACEQAVATVRPVGQAASGELAPDPTYGRRVSGIVAALEHARTSARGRMGAGAATAVIARLAAGLGGDFTRAAAALGALEPPPPAGQAQATLARALLAAGDAYAGLGRVAAAPGAGGYGAARDRVVRAEAEVAAALRSFALLGYRQPS